jgi:hypothetical protein
MPARVRGHLQAEVGRCYDPDSLGQTSPTLTPTPKNCDARPLGLGERVRTEVAFKFYFLTEFVLTILFLWGWTQRSEVKSKFCLFVAMALGKSLSFLELSSLYNAENNTYPATQRGSLEY